MSHDNSIELAVSSVLKNPILSVLREYNELFFQDQ